MKNNIIKFVKFGIPFLVLTITIYAMYFAKGGGDPEFGAIGQDAAILILLLGIIILYFIAGIIHFAISKKNFIFYSALFSIIVFLAVIFIHNGIREAKEFISNQEYETEYKKEKTEKNKTLDSLHLVVKNTPTNNKAIEERAFLYRDLYFNLTIQEQYDKSIEYFELAISHKTANLEIYKQLSFIYTWDLEYEKAIEVYKIALKYDSINDITLSEDDVNFILEEIKKNEKLIEDTKVVQ